MSIRRTRTQKEHAELQRETQKIAYSYSPNTSQKQRVPRITTPSMKKGGDEGKYVIHDLKRSLFISVLMIVGIVAMKIYLFS
ncbi:MAG: hypothetical protein UX04_C0002G0237 [Microgenomates group bacterium GW2011_GWF2_45_18]|nr:MAG: hypothetical protein UW18_C0003G0325 [Microgenomates group bacterium GW2011_GWF1_44_10]KKU02094.1 MAG: hypothetical protein UX04_C0002G0237 [Microgenomates group bacterium GW2011_GWF2_45_18]OGJ41382.1 MAG: hypothetical protein A2378_02895 [Candidatus Pacebacteria bacterium RIFOXYB1_FULL_44_10]HAU98647.1 hypothetical protein [Candidatus Paceibacterota bacterium]HAX01927.1 hypothetical protein [Candidatus Paceibacterota bacterium]